MAKKTTNNTQQKPVLLWFLRQSHHHSFGFGFLMNELSLRSMELPCIGNCGGVRVVF